MITDTNVHISRWPFRRLPGDEVAQLVGKLRQGNVTQAWASSFDAILHRDLAGVNQRLSEECRRLGDGLLVPFGSVNPTQPDWEKDLRRCHEEYGMPGIRIFPNYHGYKLDEPAFDRLLALAVERKLIVQLAVAMEDERTMHPLLRVPPVNLGPLPQALQRVAQCQVVLMNCFRSMRVEQCKPLAAAGAVYFDISMLEGVAGITKLLEYVPVERVLFGSYAPFFYWDSARLKVHESELTEIQRTKILHDNAARLLMV
jgi:uncharacterized protein